MKNIFTIFVLLLSISIYSQIVNIPDVNFKSYLLNYTPTIDTNNDGEIQVSEAESVTSLSINNDSNIYDLTGLEAFVNLTSFGSYNCSYIQILDLSHQVNLVQFDISNNASLSCINLKNGNNINVDDANSRLESLLNLQSVCLDDTNYTPYVTYGNFGPVVFIDYWGLASCTVIDPIVYFVDNDFKQGIINSVNFVSNGDLEIQLSEAINSIDIQIDSSYPVENLTGIEAFTNLQNLDIPNNNLTTLNLLNNPYLYHVDVRNNSIYYADFSHNQDLQELNISNNLISELDFSNLLYGFVEVDFSNNPNLSYINFHAPYLAENGVIYNLSNLPNLDLMCIPDLGQTTFMNDVETQVGHSVSFIETCVENQTLYVPDNLFRQALFVLGVDANNDGIIQIIEANNFDYDFSQLNSTFVYNDLTGLEQFHNIITIEIDNSIATTLPLSPIANYEIINFTNSLVTELDFSNVNFSTIYDLSNNPNLTYINLKNGWNSQLGGLELSNTPNLETVCIDDLSMQWLVDEINNNAGHFVNVIDNCATAASIQDQNNIELQVYPNPVNNTLTIETRVEINKVTIYNTLGKLITTSSKNAIDVSTFANGLYFIKIMTNTGKIATTKFIKK